MEMIVNILKFVPKFQNFVQNYFYKTITTQLTYTINQKEIFNFILSRV